MLVKFKTIKGTPVDIDSSKIFRTEDSNKIWEYKTMKSNDYWQVDDPTLTYLQNAWTHEGMRRVSVKFKNSDTIEGWFDGVNIFCPEILVDRSEYEYFWLIPYEMEV